MMFDQIINLLHRTYFGIVVKKME